MSENQWLIVNGYDSRNAENRYFQSKNKELKFTGKVPADSTGAEIFIHYQNWAATTKAKKIPTPFLRHSIRMARSAPR